MKDIKDRLKELDDEDDDVSIFNEEVESRKIILNRTELTKIRNNIVQLVLLLKEEKRSKDIQNRIMVHLTQQLLHRWKFLNPKTTKEKYFYRYNPKIGIWTNDAVEFIQQFIQEVDSTLTNHFKNEVIHKVMHSCYIENEDIFNSKPYLALKNGVLDLNNLTIIPYSDDYYLTRLLPITYDPEATCPVIEQFLKDISDNNQDMIDTLLEGAADCLEPHYYSQKMLMLVGKGSNGKGTWFRLLQGFLGEKNISSLTIQQISDNFKTWKLYFSLANLAGDISTKKLKFTGTLKQCRGEDGIMADRKHMDMLYFSNRSKMWFSCQEVPTSDDDTDGWHRSWVIINFNRQFTNETKDYEMTKKIVDPLELSGLLNLVLQALIRLRTNKYIFTLEKYTPTIESKRKQYILNSNNVISFCEFRLENKFDNWIAKDVVLDAYKKYCVEIGSSPYNNAYYSKLLKESMVNIRASKKRIDGVQVPGWINITFSESETSETSETGDFSMYDSMKNNNKIPYKGFSPVSLVSNLPNKLIQFAPDEPSTKHLEHDPTKIFSQENNGAETIKKRIVQLIKANTQVKLFPAEYVTLKEIMNAINYNNPEIVKENDINKIIESLLQEGIIYEPMNQKYKLT